MRQQPQYDHPINRWKFEPAYRHKIQSWINLVLGFVAGSAVGMLLL